MKYPPEVIPGESIVERLELYTQLFGQRLVGWLHKDRPVFEDNGWHAAHTAIGCHDKLFSIFIAVNIDKIILNIILIQITSRPAAITAPGCSVYRYCCVSHDNAPICR
jgi:hypothetical protein